ncbi:MAG: DUF1295 domain-containing protein [Myxococcota bacterium]
MPLLAALSVTAGPSLLALLVGAGLLWIVSVVRRDASVADPAWGPAFLLIAGVSFLVGASPGPRPWIVLAMVGLWAGRLGIHLLRRNRSHGEDPRYVAMRDAHGPRFVWVSLFTVFLLQAGLAWLVSLPVQAGIAGVAPLGVLDGIGVLVWATGFLCEAAADAQLARFRADPASRGTVLDAGLWRYSRHPNYFGDALLWWGFGLVALSTGAWMALVGPAIMTVLIVRVSGVSLLERDIADRRPAYRDYVRRTSAFVPWPPKR